jgi:hypothetical protein
MNTFYKEKYICVFYLLMQKPDDTTTVFLGKRRLRPLERGWRERRENFRNLSVSHPCSFINLTKDAFQCRLCLDKDNKRMADKIAAENAERQKKEEEMAQRLKEAQEVRSL